MDLTSYTTYFWHRRKLRQYLCLEAFSIIINESSISTNQYFLAFLVWPVNCSSLIINLILDIFRYAVSAYITGYLVLSYIEKLISTVGHFFSNFLLINMSWMPYYFRYLNYAKYFRHVQKIKHCLCLKLFSVFISGKFSYNYFLHF